MSSLKTNNGPDSRSVPQTEQITRELPGPPESQETAVG